jgi:hypothetical protein
MVSRLLPRATKTNVESKATQLQKLHFFPRLDSTRYDMSEAVLTSKTLATNAVEDSSVSNG